MFLVQHSCKALVEKITRLDLNLALFPDELNVLKNKHLAFKVVSGQYNVTNQNTQYSISKVSNDMEIIKELTQKLNMQDDLSQSEGENITPSSVTKLTSYINDMPSTLSTMKRNLDEVIDVDDTTQSSTTKTRRFDEDDIEDVLSKPSVASSMFLSWMKCNELYEEAKQLTYIEFPTKFVWKLDGRTWEPRKKAFSVGRIHTVSPKLEEAYFLRILLNKVKGPKSFEDIRTFNGETFPTFRDACYA
ncbi:hypothetical protein LXL04_038259 [Taraxacum kok-saghyz]